MHKFLKLNNSCQIYCTSDIWRNLLRLPLCHKARHNGQSPPAVNNYNKNFINNNITIRKFAAHASGASGAVLPHQFKPLRFFITLQGRRHRPRTQKAASRQDAKRKKVISAAPTRPKINDARQLTPNFLRTSLLLFFGARVFAKSASSRTECKN